MKLKGKGGVVDFLHVFSYIEFEFQNFSSYWYFFSVGNKCIYKRNHYDCSQNVVIT